MYTVLFLHWKRPYPVPLRRSREIVMAEGSELKDEIAVLGQHMQKFFIEDCRPWAEVSENIRFAPKAGLFSLHPAQL